jgi:formate/nitrite transporter FocA (FNT family)
MLPPIIGDVAIPLIFFVGVLRTFQDWFLVGAAIAGALVGLGLIIYYVTSVKRIALPALPPIMGGSIISLGLAFLIQSFL